MRASRASSSTRASRCRSSPPPSSSARPGSPCTGSCASSRGSRRTARRRAATTSSRTRSSRASRRRPRAGAVAFKSVIAYRTGLDITHPSLEEARAAYTRWRADGFRETRTHGKPVRDLLLERTLEVAGAAGVPVHIHSGGGDPDSLVPHARPAGLFDLLKRHPRQPVLLIHAGLAVDGRSGVPGLDPPPRPPRPLDRHPVGIARGRPADRDRARRRAAREGAVRLGRGQRARGGVVLGARRARGARARADPRRRAPLAD